MLIHRKNRWLYKNDMENDEMFLSFLIFDKKLKYHFFGNPGRGLIFTIGQIKHLSYN